MRDFLNAILSVVAASSLTDDEYGTFDPTLSVVFSLTVYNGLLAVLDSRESMSSTRDRLRYYFLALGFDIEATPAGASNILIGSAL